MSDDLGDGVAYRIDAAGVATRFDWTAGPASAQADGLAWIHLNLRSAVTQRWLAGESGLDPIVAEALLEDETRPRCVPMDSGLLVILRGVNLNPGADPEDMVALRIWAAQGLVVSTRRRPLVAVRELRRDIDSGRGPRDAGDFLVEVSGRLVERMAGVLAALEERVDAVEESLSESSVESQRSELTSLRRQAIGLRRYLAPQRDALARLHNERVAWLSDSHRLRLREVADATIRYVEDLEATRERTALTQEELNSRLSEQLNKRMYVLSMVAGVFLPLGFITGLLGINVGGIPGSDDPTAFALVCLALLGVGAGLVAVLRRLGWL